MAITVLPSISVVELLLDRRLDFRIERRGRLVEDQDRRVLQQHAGDRDALALAARELDAALADMRVEALAPVLVGQPGDELDAPRRGAPPRSSRFGRVRIGHRRCCRAIERCSSDVSCVTMPICARRLSCVTLGDVLSVDQDAPALEVVEAQQQVDQRRLAGARTADEADLLAGPDGQRQVLDDARCPCRSGSRSTRYSILPAETEHRPWRPGDPRPGAAARSS